jgi:hypothetical protein
VGTAFTTTSIRTALLWQGAELRTKSNAEGDETTGRVRLCADLIAAGSRQRREVCPYDAPPPPLLAVLRVLRVKSFAFVEFGRDHEFQLADQRVANFSAHWIRAVVCIVIKSVKIAPVVIASPVNPSKKNA